MAQAKRHNAFALTQYTTRSGEERTKWTRIGVAFHNDDGSVNVELEAFPASGRMQIREETEEEAERREEAGRRRETDTQRNDARNRNRR